MAVGMGMNFRGLQAELNELERTDPKVRADCISYDLMVEKITGRTLCPICGGCGWFDDEHGRAECSCQEKRND